MTGIGDRPSDPAAESREGSQAEPGLTVVGFWDAAGGRLYLNEARNQYLEFRQEDVREFGDVDPAHAPFLGQQATWVKLEPNAQVEFIRTGPAEPADDFAVEVRLRGRAAGIGNLVDEARFGTTLSGKRCEIIDDWTIFVLPGGLNR
jgi:hypothetical protein